MENQERIHSIRSALDGMREIEALNNRFQAGLATGAMIIKPLPDMSVQYLPQTAFIPVEYDTRGRLTKVIFPETKKSGDAYFTRLEYHSLEKSGLTITNRAYISYSKGELGRETALAALPEWQSIAPAVTYPKITRPVFGYYRNPIDNTIDGSFAGVSVFESAVDLIRRTDMQFGRLDWEFESGERVIHVSSSALKAEGRDKNGRTIFGLPKLNKRLYRAVDISNKNGEELFKEFSPEFREQSIISGLEEYKRNIEFSVGLSYGDISNPTMVEKTATEVAAAKKRKYNTVTAIQENLRDCLDDLVYTLAFWSAKTTSGYEFVCDFKDSILADDETERQQDRSDVDVTSGAFDYNTVLKRTVREFTDSGIRFVDYDGKRPVTARIEVAARRAVMTGVNQVVAKVNEDNAAKLETDVFEVSWHSGARFYPGGGFRSHLDWQGRWYTMAQLESVCGYGNVAGLCGANCYHDFDPVIPGISEPTYTEEELAKMKQDELTPRVYGGKEYTKYEAMQRQRALERTMRTRREEIKCLQDGGAKEDDVVLARASYQAVSQEYTRFSKSMGLPQQRERVTVDGLGTIGKGKTKISGAAVNPTVIKPKVDTSTVEINLDKSGKSDIINLLPNSDKVVMPDSKLLDYALNPQKAPDKAKAFYEALGYNLSNAEKLKENIFNNIKNFNAVEKGDNGYGMRYETLMSLIGENGKSANVKVGWILDNATKETRMTSAYVTAKKRKEKLGEN